MLVGDVTVMLYERMASDLKLTSCIERDVRIGRTNAYQRAHIVRIAIDGRWVI